MGGLYPKMKITALTMLVGVLAIAGTPLLQRLVQQGRDPRPGARLRHRPPQHVLLFVLPLVTAGITTFYMFRMWFMTFTGKPRDQHVYEHAHESPWVMTVPLIVLAVFSVVRRLGLAAVGRRGELPGAHDPPRAARRGDGRLRRTSPTTTSSWRRRRRRPSAADDRAHGARAATTWPGMLALGMVGARHRVRAADLLLPRARPGRGEGAVPRRARASWRTSGTSTSCTARCWCGRRWSSRGWCKRVRPERASTASSHGAGRGDGAAWRGGDGRFDNGVVDGLVNLVGRRDLRRRRLAARRADRATCAATSCSWCWRRSACSCVLTYFVAVAAAS